MKTKTKEHSEIFRDWEIRAILAGTKTQFRRIVKPQPKASHLGYMAVEGGALQCGADYPDGDDDFVPCPYGKPGERLWVREDFWHDEPYHMDYCASCIFVADHPSDFDPRIGQNYPFVEYVRRRAREMKRFLSRIDLEITGVRVERVQDISPKDAIAEGYCPSRGNEWDKPEIYRTAADMVGGPFPRGVFAHTWNKIHGAGSWEANPWVWVREFKTHKIAFADRVCRDDN